MPSSFSPTLWLLDSGASHHVTSNLANLSLHSPYDNTYEIIIDDGSRLAITHTGSTLLPTSTHSLYLSNIFCVLSMHTNIIFISKLCHDYNVLVIFSPSPFSGKDSKMWPTLLTGQSKDGVY